MNGDDCPVCLSYSAETQRELDRAGRAHEYAMSAIRSVEVNGVGRAVAMGATWGIPDELEFEEAETAIVLGF